MKILLCDDHRMFAESLADALALRGDEVAVTVAPADAVDTARRWQPDLCVLDRTFPGGDLGVEAARAVLQAAPDTVVLMLTGRADAAGARAALGAGARGFVRKDVPLDQVLGAVDQVAGGLLVVDPAVLRPDDDRAGKPAGGLTARELEVLERLVHGESGQAMASAMQVSYSTLRTHVQNILAKLGVHSQLEAAAYAVQHGLVEPQAG